MGDTAMYTIEWHQGAPTLSEAAQALHVTDADLDRSFGVVLLDPGKNEYAVLCKMRACDQATGSSSATHGPFSNPPIGAFGPLQGR